jgi:hypothetical protein
MQIQNEVTNMDNTQKWISLVVAIIAIVSLAVTAVTANTSWKSSNTPLYTFRMEHASNDRNFL